MESGVPPASVDGAASPGLRIPLLGWLALSGVSWACLLWLLLWYVPRYADMYLYHMPLPALARGILAAELWLLTLLPFVIILGVTTWFLSRMIGSRRTIGKAALLAILVSGPAALVASCVVVYGVHSPVGRDLQETWARAGGDRARAELDVAGGPLSRACHWGSAFACLTVGQMVLEGHVGESNPAVARVFLEKACDGGSHLGCEQLARAREMAGPTRPTRERSVSAP